MVTKKDDAITCTRGHKFNRTDNRPVCPKCWPGYYERKKKTKSNKTKMTLRHEGLPAGKHSEAANAGWNESFDKLAASL